MTPGIRNANHCDDNKPNAEVVEDGVNGLLVQNSVESLAEGMLHFVKKPECLDAVKPMQSRCARVKPGVKLQRCMNKEFIIHF